MRFIYFDYAATTPIDLRVATKMQQYLTTDGIFGNPASPHSFGIRAKNAVEASREQVASLINASSNEIVWTSGATEADNLALKGAAQLYQQKGKHIITVKTEHSAVIDCCQILEKWGFQVTYLTPQKNGLIDHDSLIAAIRPDTILISIMHVNNEIGVIQDIAGIGQIAKDKNILFHVDAAQSAGKILIDVNAMQIDLLSICAHKIYGPKGIGALYVRKKPRVRVAAQIHGGGHENNMRSGTLATHQIVGMGEAFALAKEEMQKDFEKITLLREKFLTGLKKNKNIFLNTDPSCSVPNIINFGIHGMKADEIMKALPSLAISSGSACHSKGVEPSYVLRALGLSFLDAASSVRFSLGRFTTEDEIDRALEEVSKLTA